MGPNNNGFLQSIQVLRQLIASRHSYEASTVTTNMKDNGGAIRKLNWQLSGVFEKKERQARLNTLSALIGRQIISTTGHGGLTCGEVYALLDWCNWENYFPMLEPDAELVLLRLRDEPEKWVPYLNKHLEPMTVVKGAYAQGTLETF